MSLSNYLENAHLDVVYHGVAHPVPAQIWVALFTADPTDAGGGAEVAANLNAAPTGYTRVRVFRAVGEGTPYWAANEDEAGGGRQTKNSHDFEFPEFLQDIPAAVTHWGTFDAAAGGNLLDHAPFDAQQLFKAGSVPRIKAGQLKIQRR